MSSKPWEFQSHSSFRHNICVRFRGTDPKYPDMSLYEEIVFLQHYAECKWAVENVRPYYGYLIEPTQVLMRHPFWANFEIPNRVFEKDNLRKAQIPDLQDKYGYDLAGEKLPNKRQVLRNCVDPELGKYILELADTPLKKAA